MSQPDMNTDPSSENGPVNQAIAVYLEGVASGQPPDQELFLAKYANIRTELESFLNAYGNLNRLEFAATHERNDEHAARQIGDYFLLRNVGQGGMGVVFEATQLSLNRRVAIKLLPFLATLDQRRVDRFRIESMAIASLDHPNIAEVFAVGHDDGLHYFAMRFIDG